MNNITKTLFLLVTSLSFHFGYTQTDTSINFDTATFFNEDLYIAPDNPIVKSIDEMLLSYNKSYDYFTKDTFELNLYNEDPNSIPEITDSLMKARLEILDDATPLTFEFNAKSKAFINLYINRRRKLTSIMLARKEYYFPIFEEMLAKHKIPQELKYLAIVESALKPNAESWAGASGLWQFMYNTGKQYGLKATSYTDDRKDPYKSTEAACKHLKDLYNIYDNWELALAAYNSGAGNVNKAIRKSGGKKNFWAIYDFLPKETQGYVPAFIAVNYAMNYASEHNIYPKNPRVKFYEMDTIYVSDRIDFKIAAKYLDVSKDVLTYLNPRYILEVIPNIQDQSQCLYLPQNKLGLFLANEDSIIHYSREYKKTYGGKTFASSADGSKIRYRVRSGDYLGKISQRYGCRVSDIKKWNNLRGNNLRVGQRLTIYSKKRGGSKTKKKKTKPKIEKIKGYTYYTIQNGDNLWDISQKFPGVSVDDLTKHNKNLNHKNLKVGTKIKIVKH